MFYRSLTVAALHQSDFVTRCRPRPALAFWRGHAGPSLQRATDSVKLADKRTSLPSARFEPSLQQDKSGTGPDYAQVSVAKCPAGALVQVG